MSDQYTHITPAQTRSELAGIIRDASEAMELLGLYGDVYADEISEEIGALLGRIGVRGHVLRKQHMASHKRDSAFSDEVGRTLARLEVVGGELSLLQATAEAEDRQGVWWDHRATSPQEDREDRTAQEDDK